MLLTSEVADLNYGVPIPTTTLVPIKYLKGGIYRRLSLTTREFNGVSLFGVGAGTVFFEYVQS